MGQKNVLNLAVRITKVNQLIDIIEDSLRAQNPIGDKSSARMRNGQTVGRSYFGDMVRCFAPPATSDILLREGSDSSRAEIPGASRLTTLNDYEGFAFIDRFL